MSTVATADFRASNIKYPHTFLEGLEADFLLFQPAQLRERLLALDDLDAVFGGLDSEDFARCSDWRIYRRAKMLRTELEAANAELYQSVRSEIVRSGRSHVLLRWLQRSADGSQVPGLGFDWRDELLSEVLQLCEPGEPDFRLSPEMVFYQPTPVRHILHLIAATALAKDDCFVDIGSGLGHVSLLVSMLTGAQSLGIEVQPAYVDSAWECAQSLRLNRVRFIPQDAREADLSNGTAFYLYSPFNGRVLTDMLSALRIESTHRAIRICSLGPCTHAIANETWLKASAPPDTGRIAVFESR
jgi:Histone methylation protein DOT1